MQPALATVPILQHSALDGIVTIGVIAYCLKELHMMKMDFSDESHNELIKVDKIELRLSDEMITDSAIARAEFMSKAQNISFKLHTFSGYGKNKIKTFGVHPDSFVQVNIQVAAYKTHQRYYCTYKNHSVTFMMT